MADWMLRLIEQTQYLGIALLMLLENVIPPIPSEVVMGIAGIEAGQGKMSLPLVVVAGTAGSVIGNYFWYWIGYHLGIARLRPFVERWGRWLTLDWTEVERLQAFFVKHDATIVFWCRILPTFRTMISLPAGLVRMPQWKFLLWTGIGAGIWNAVLASAGYWLGQKVTTIDRYVGPLSSIIIASIIIFYIWRVLTWRPKG